MITIKEFYGDVKDIDESVLAVKSDSLYPIVNLSPINNLIGNLEIRRLVVYNVLKWCNLYLILLRH